MSAACEGVRRDLPGYESESLPAERRRALREHLALCVSCRVEAASVDPVLLFATLPAAEVSSGEVASVVASVRAGIALRQAERRIEGGPVRPGARTRTRLALGVAAAAAVLLAIAVPAGLKSRTAPVRVAGAKAASAPTPGISAVAAPGSDAKVSGAATVYDWNPGAGEPRVVWIVDGSLDI